jgi:hypothetical protein
VTDTDGTSVAYMHTTPMIVGATGESSDNPQIRASARVHACRECDVTWYSIGHHCWCCGKPATIPAALLAKPLRDVTADA